ncbi:MAG: hypothetical protein ACNA8W_02015 [Bradymonadaceae bacterium]
MGVTSPVRLRTDADFSQVQMPSGVEIEDVQDIILSLLYPRMLNAGQRAKVSGSRAIKIAGMLETSKGHIRIMRGPDIKSISVQRQKGGKYEDLATGPSDVQAFLEKHFHLPDMRVCLALNMWRFDVDAAPVQSGQEDYGDDPRIPELVEMYRTALTVETIEDRAKDLDGRILEGQRALGQSAELEEKLERAREKLAAIALPELAADEISLLKGKEARLDEFDQQIGRLIHEEDTERRQVDMLLPNKPYRQPVFLVGLGIALMVSTISIVSHEEMRSIALVNIFAVGLVAWVLLQYFNNLGRASVHQVRLESIKRRLNQLREEQVFFLEKIEHVLIHAGVSDEAELEKRVPMVDRLNEVIHKMEEQLDAVQSNAQYRQARDQLDTLIAERKELQAQREELPSFVMNSFQLENDLKSLDVDPVAVRNAGGTEDAGADEEQDTTAFQRLRRVAELAGLWQGSSLDLATQKMWSKICGHVLSDRFANVALTTGGELEVSDLTQEQLELWFSTRSSEVRAVQAALALAMKVNAEEDALRSLWIGDPARALTPGHAAKFEPVFKSAAKKSHIVICKS